MDPRENKLIPAFESALIFPVPCSARGVFRRRSVGGASRKAAEIGATRDRPARRPRVWFVTTRSGGLGTPPLGITTECREPCWKGRRSGQARTRPEKRGPGDLKSPLVERRKARGLKPMRPLRIREDAVLLNERRPVLHLPLDGGSDCRRARAFQTTGPAERWLFEPFNSPAESPTAPSCRRWSAGMSRSR